jgi:hypothetical protein
MNTTLLTAILLTAFAPPAAKPAPAETVTLPGLENEHAGLTREDVLKSAEWRQTMLTLSTWFDTQRMYSPEQVLEFKRRINQEAMEASPTDLLRLQHNLTEKLAILNGPQARALRTWLREQLSLASDEFGKQIMAGLPDISRLTPDQLQDYLNKFTARIEAERAGNQQFLAAKSQQSQMVTSKLAQQREASQRAMSQAVSSGGWGGNGGVIGARNVTGGQIPTAAGYYSSNFGWGGGWGGRW